MLVGVAGLELLNNVFVTLDGACHLLLEVIELPLEFLSLALLEAHLQNLLVEVVLDELHLEEHVTRFVNAILRRVQIRLVPIFPRGLILLLAEAERVVLGVLRVLGYYLTLILVFNRVDDFGINEVTLRCKAFNGKTN